jgi:hypothetical protein
MAKVIEFHVPKNFQATRPQPGKVIEFCSQAGKGVRTRHAGRVLAWLRDATESNRAVSSE